MARGGGTPLCAWFADGRVACVDPGVPGSSGAPLAVPADLRAERLFAPWDGGFCAAGPQGSARCVGERTPLVAAMPEAATAGAFGDTHACAIVGGTIQCWGAASFGQLGTGQTFLHSRPVRVPGLADAVQLDASSAEVCALRRASGAVCWGQAVDESGRLRADFVLRAVELPPGAQAIRAAGPDVRPMCARVSGPAGADATANPKAWRCLSSSGWNPPTESFLGALASLKMRQIARNGPCGVDAQGHLVCAVGLPVGATRAAGARPVILGSGFVEAASGLFDDGHLIVCGRSSDQRVACFRADEGSAAKPLDTPSIAALTGVMQISAAGQGEDSMACALTGTGAVSCWGDGRYGQLGGAVLANRLIAVSISNLPPLAEIAVGGTFACGRTAAGEVFCWGSNRQGAVPDGNASTSDAPRAVQWPPAH
jgi:serine/threonine-protein kinase